MRPSIDELRAVAQPPGLLDRGSAEHWAGRLYMRRLSIYFTRFAIRLGASANQLTALMVFVGLTGAAVLGFGGLWSALLAVLLIQFYLLLDCSDGEVARWNGTTSTRGVFLDRVGHYVVESALIVGLGLRAASGDLLWLAVGLAGALGSVLIKAVADIANAVAPVQETGKPASETPPFEAARRLAYAFPIHRAIGAVELSLLILAAAIVDQVVDTVWFTRGLLVGVSAMALLLVFVRTIVISRSDRFE